MALNLHNSSGKGRMWSRAAGQAGGMGDYVLFFRPDPIFGTCATFFARGLRIPLPK